ncbi:MAG: hypothetical protein U0169_05305 [Polyangiaceae bacterium]
MRPMATLGLLALSACARHPVSPNSGAADVATGREHVRAREGDRDGYSVRRPCEVSTLAVVGKGRGSPSTLDDAAARDRLRARVLDVLASLRSVHGTGFGAPCRGRDVIAVHVYLSDPREVDVAVELLGTWLKREDSGDEVDVTVSAVPVAD